MRSPNPSSAPASLLNGVTTLTQDLTFDFGLDKRPVGSGARVDLISFMRRVKGGNYRAVLRVLTTGVVQAQLARSVPGVGGSALGSFVTVPGVTYDVGDRLVVRTQAIGGSPTQLRVKVWESTQPEPTAWTVTAQDSSAGLQVAGSPGLSVDLTSGVSNTPVVAFFDDVVSVLAGSAP